MIKTLIPWRVLFVCMGNICRSPTAEGVFRKIAKNQMPEFIIEIDSAGTHAYHIGESPDPRSCAAAKLRGVDISSQRGRRIIKEDFSAFDLVLAMDRLNYQTLIDMCPSDYHQRIKLFMDFASDFGHKEVPDPYFGDSDGFEQVLDLVEEASLGLLVYMSESTPPTG
jgi:protein-tyrosine phosphatase